MRERITSSRLLSTPLPRKALVAFFALGVLSLTHAFSGSNQYEPGDTNLHGSVDLNDIDAFSVAAQRPDIWRNRYGGTNSDMFRVADFSGNSSVGIEDIDGFAAEVGKVFDARLALTTGATSLDREARAGSSGSRGVTRGIDLDVDSNNDDGTALPERSDAEETVEDVAGLPGKIILYEDLFTASPARYPAVLIFDTDSSNLTCDYGRIITWYVNYDTNRVTLYSWLSGTTTYGDYNSGSPTFTRRYWYAGDTNGNKVVNTADIGGFVLALTDPGSFGSSLPCTPMVEACDFNGDGSVTSADTPYFVAAVTSGTAKPTPIQLRIEADPERSTSLGDISIEVTATVGNTWFGTTCWGSGCSCGSPPCDTFTDEVTLMVDSLPGGSRPWSASIAVNPFSSLDLRSGTVTTTVNLAEIDPHGPPLKFNLYHSSQPSAVAEPYTPFTGVGLPTNWRASYGSYVRGLNGDSLVTVVRADGTIDLYTEHVSGAPTRAYDPPHGVFNDLRWDDEYNDDEGAWVLTTPAQWKTYFVEVGTTGLFRFDAVADSTGNVSRFEPTDGFTVDRVVSSANSDDFPSIRSRIEFYPNGDDVLVDSNQSYNDTWFKWDVQTLELTIYDFARHKATMNDDGRIVSFHEHEPYGIAWAYEYYDSTSGDNSGRLWKVIDPNGVFEQVFEYELLGNGQTATHYTDRRGQEWIYQFDAAGNLVRITQPLGSPAYFQEFTYDSQHNRLTAKDELAHTWIYTYGAIGNVATLASPLTGSSAQSWIYTWSQPSGAMWNFYRFDQVTDPLTVR